MNSSLVESHLLSGPTVPFFRLLWGHPNAKVTRLLRNPGASWWPSAFRSRSGHSGICSTMRTCHLHLPYFPRLFFFTIQNFSLFCFGFFLPFLKNNFKFLFMYSAHITGCQFHFIVPFKGQINLCFYKEKIKDQLSWASMHICYLSLQPSSVSLEEILPFSPSCLISWYAIAVT